MRKSKFLGNIADFDLCPERLPPRLEKLVLFLFELHHGQTYPNSEFDQICDVIGFIPKYPQVIIFL